MIKVKRALISVSDKKGLVSFAQDLAAMGVEILSTGGTARLFRENNIPVTDVSDHTGFPEMMDGRVKTLHPKIHGGLLAVRDNPDHMAQAQKHKIGMIDLVVVNLYPFGKVIQKPKVSLPEAIENIDIGGPSMLRSAAKNYTGVAVVCNPDRYQDIMQELKQNNGMLSDAILFKLSVEAFQHTAQYDTMIAKFLNHRLKVGDMEANPPTMDFSCEKIQELRYGENPHQRAAFYKDNSTKAWGLANLKQLHGKELSFNNILDLHAAMEFVRVFERPAAVVIKHNNPSGLAVEETLAKAYQQAWTCDPLSAFGGIIGVNRPLDAKTAELIHKSGFMECVIAPSFSQEALDILSVKPNLRLIEIALNDMPEGVKDIKQVNGGFLVQDRDEKIITKADLKIVTKKKPTASQIESLLFGWLAIRNVKSNAILLVKGTRLVGVGCGLPSRVDSLKHAIDKAGDAAKGSLLVSDAFFPKTDNIEAAAKAGVKAIIQPGGSIADADVIKACDAAGIAMVFTGVRHFKH